MANHDSVQEHEGEGKRFPVPLPKETLWLKSSPSLSPASEVQQWDSSTGNQPSTGVPCSAPLPVPQFLDLSGASALASHSETPLRPANTAVCSFSLRSTYLHLYS